MGSDEARRAILARRARFITAALASLAIGGCERKPEVPSEPCLSIAPDRPDAEPRVCLTPMRQPEGDAGNAEPQVCLSKPIPRNDERDG